MHRVRINMLLLSLFIFLLGCGRNDGVTDFSKFRFSGPYRYRNLSLFLVHGKDKAAYKNVMTLQEALRSKLAIVYETGTVNQLKVKNISSNRGLFILSGDIVKGGKQDRVIKNSQVISAGAKTVLIDTFCVESGRWRKRGVERVSRFSSSDNMIATKSIKLGVRKYKSQSKVWGNIAKVQGKLSRSLGSDVRSRQSRSSLQLTLENRKVRQAKRAYLTALRPVLKSKKDVLGYVFVINGKISSAEIFSSSAIFKKLWLKLLRSSIVEAITEFKPGARHPVVSKSAILRFLVAAENGKRKKEVAASGRVGIVQKESSGKIMFETRNCGPKKGWINKSYINKK